MAKAKRAWLAVAGLACLKEVLSSTTCYCNEHGDAYSHKSPGSIAQQSSHMDMTTPCRSECACFLMACLVCHAVHALLGLSDGHQHPVSRTSCQAVRRPR